MTGAARLRAFEVGLIGVALILAAMVPALVQRAGFPQPWAVAAGVTLSLLTLYPVMLRWWRTGVPLLQWAGTIAAIVAASLILQFAFQRL